MADADARTADRLIEVAAALFREHGYSATTKRELSESLGIQKASLYYHISGKEDLLHQICRRSLERITEAVQLACAAAEPRERLEVAINAHVRSALADRDLHTTMLIELRVLTPQRRDEVLAMRTNYEAMIEAVITEGQTGGWVRSDLSARFLTLALLNLLNWTIFWYSPDGVDDIEDIGHGLGLVFLRGVLVEP